MKLVLPLLFALLLLSCGNEPTEVVSSVEDTAHVGLRLPFVKAGIPVDTTLTALHIFFTADKQQPLGVILELPSNRLTDTVNVFADSLLSSDQVDSIVNFYCEGKDLRLIGINNGIELAIPFHALHRFKPVTDTIGRRESEFHELFVEESEVQINEMVLRYANAEDYFKAFYGDAFNPVDSNAHLPRRESGRQIVESLMFEADGWNDVDPKQEKDSARSLAAYNEFVNKLEIYDKVESFCMLRESVMECLPVSVTWARVMQVFGEHYSVVSSLRESAKQYLADKIANEGGDPNKQFTDEDLRLLYPDRLRWNGRISGTHEHRYDGFLLAEFYWTDPLNP